MKINRLGDLGVSVDKADMEMADNEFRSTQNIIGGYSVDGVGTRRGLIAANASVAAGAVLGGIIVPLAGQSRGGASFLFIGRGPAT